MIAPEILRKFLRKTEGLFVSIDTLSKQLVIKNKSSSEILAFLEAMGYIEALSDQLWVLSTRGKILAFRDQKRVFKAETLRKHLRELVERAQYINSSTDYPDEVRSLKIISVYPVNDRGTSLSIAYYIKRKEISDEDYEKAANKLRLKYNGAFANYVEQVFYPQTALRSFLKSGSPALELRQYTSEEMKLLEGTVLFELG